ncbi:ER membrane complex subunit 3 [Coelomomyces lativittatus]|nr:ER membrane complex subunit 3 [Coelomomyces lativittatus]KAJ1513312.1 ER membrane complex subunit 3 [Coelomomyces lativittatus]
MLDSILSLWRQTHSSSSLHSEIIVLDPALRNWVLLPILTVMVLVGILRHYLTLVFNLSVPKKMDFLELKQSNALLRSHQLQKHHLYLPSTSVQLRKQYLISNFKNGHFLKPTVTNHSGAPDVAGMEVMMEGMKKNFAMIVPQTIIMSLINMFFSGFLLIHLPFPLTVRFKSMLQNGILTPDLDARWVSSLSWYFLNLFGLNPLFRILLGNENAADGTRDLANPAMGMQNAFPQTGMANQAMVRSFQNEADNLQLLPESDQGRIWIDSEIDTKLQHLLSVFEKKETSKKSTK